MHLILWFHQEVKGTGIYAAFGVSQTPNIDTRERETRSFVKLYNFIPESKCLLITNSEEAMLDCEGISIEVVSVWKWLLQCSMNNKNEDYV